MTNSSRYTPKGSIALENRPTAQQAAQRLELSKLLAKVIRQTSFADGHSAPATRIWLDDIQLAQNRLGPNHTIEVATSTVKYGIVTTGDRIVYP